MVPYGNDVMLGNGHTNARYGIGDGAQDVAGTAVIGGMQVPTVAGGQGTMRVGDGETKEERDDVLPSPVAARTRLPSGSDFP